MNIHKLIKKAESYLSSKERKRKEKRKYLKSVIKKLRKHESELKSQLGGKVNGDGKARIQKEIAIAHAQRKKGLKKLKELKKV